MAGGGGGMFEVKSLCKFFTEWSKLEKGNERRYAKNGFLKR